MGHFLLSGIMIIPPFSTSEIPAHWNQAQIQEQPFKTWNITYISSEFKNLTNVTVKNAVCNF